MTRPYVIGVTGSIACGKSAVMSELKDLGVTILDGDLVYRDLTGSGSPLVQRLAEVFGAQIVHPDGSLNRAELGKIVFSDPAALTELDRITHPPVVEEVVRRIALATTPMVATDGIKLLESGMGDRCDEIWLVLCDPERQRERLIARNGLSPEEADRRIAAQLPVGDKLGRAGVVIENNGTLAELKAQVVAAWMASAAKATDRGYLTDGYES